MQSNQLILSPQPAQQPRTKFAGRPGPSSRVPSSTRVHRSLKAGAEKAKPTATLSHDRSTSDSQQIAKAESSATAADFDPTQTNVTMIPSIGPCVNLSQANLGKEKNKPHKPPEKLLRKPSSTGPAKANAIGADADERPAPRTQVHFALGADGSDDGRGSDGGDEEDEWVDASGSASPFLSRAASIRSDHSNHGALEAASDRLENRHDTDISDVQSTERTRPVARRTNGDLAVGHNHLFTSKLLQRVPSSQKAVAPEVSPLMASGTASQNMSLPTSAMLTHGTTPSATSSQISPHNFIALPGDQKETLASHSIASTVPGGKSRAHDNISEDDDDRALAPKQSRRMLASGPSDNYRTQMKLELQRASAVTEPGPVAGGSVGMGSLIGVAGIGSGNSSRKDHRVTKLLERTNMEYLVVRRYQNPLDRSFQRLRQVELSEKLKLGALSVIHADTSQTVTTAETVRQDHDGIHIQNGNMPDRSSRQSVGYRFGLSRTLSAIGVAAHDSGRQGERFSVGDETQQTEDGQVDMLENQTTLMLRQLWDQPVLQ